MRAASSAATSSSSVSEAGRPAVGRADGPTQGHEVQPLEAVLGVADEVDDIDRQSLGSCVGQAGLNGALDRSICALAVVGGSNQQKVGRLVRA